MYLCTYVHKYKMANSTKWPYSNRSKQPLIAFFACFPPMKLQSTIIWADLLEKVSGWAYSEGVKLCKLSVYPLFLGRTFTNVHSFKFTHWHVCS